MFVVTRRSEFGRDHGYGHASHCAPLADSLRAVPSAQSLTVSAVYHLSEAGRKASLLAGGDGAGIQRLTVQVPATRLHLVSVGVAVRPV